MSEKTRLRRDELKELVLEAGVELLHEDGLGAKTAPIGYADAFRWLNDHHSISVSRAQVHRRIWDSLDDYRRDVLLAIVSYTPGHSYVATIEALDASMSDLDTTDSTTAERTAMVTDLAVQLTETNAESLRNQRSIAAFDAVFVMFTVGRTETTGTSDVRRLIIDSNRSVMQRFLQVYEYIADVFNAAPGAGWGLDRAGGLSLFAELIGCLNHGASGRSAFEPTLQAIELGGRIWTVEGLGAAALAEHVAMIDQDQDGSDPTPTEPPLAVADPDGASSDISTEPVPTGRIDRDTLRTLMINAGVAVLVEQGFGHGAEQITYSRVFERLQEKHDLSIARAQVHGRIWASQNDFQLELLRLATLARDSSHAEATAERAGAEVARTDLDAPGGPELAVARAIRVGAEDTLQATISSVPWMLAQAVMAFHALNTERSDVVGSALHESYEYDVADWADVFRTIAKTVGYEPKAWTQLSLDRACVVAARVVDVISDGVVARTRMMGEVSSYRVTIAGDEPAEWNLLALGCWCVIDFLMEPQAG